MVCVFGMGVAISRLLLIIEENQMKNITPKILLATCLVASSSAALASDEWKEDALDAWIDGKAETTLLLNSNLNSFDINTNVANKVVTLTGSVDNKTEKSLAEELVSGLEGVASVNNELTVVKETTKQDSDMLNAITDSKITAVVKTRLLMDSNVSGTDINVDTEEKVVTLIGNVESDSEHDLALSIARNVRDVNKVVDELTVIQ